MPLYARSISCFRSIEWAIAWRTLTLSNGLTVTFIMRTWGRFRWTRVSLKPARFSRSPTACSRICE